MLIEGPFYPLYTNLAMKFVFKLILTILFIPLFLILLIGVTVRFQLLVPSFWENTFSASSTYSKLSISVNKNLESRVVAEGGKASDVKILTDLITPGNLKDTVDKNIDNVLQYANGKVNEIIIYIPVNKIPGSLLSKNFDKVTEQMSLTELLKEFNIHDISPVQIQMISRVGIGAWFFLVIICLISALLLYLLYLLIGPGKRIIAPGVALILAGVMASFATFSGTIVLINWAKDLVGSSNLGDSIIGIVVPPVIQGVLRTWLLLASTAIVLGVVLLFLRKPYNKSNKSK